MYHRYNGPLDGRYSICTIEAIWNHCFTELVFCGLSCFPFGYIIFLTLSTPWREMGIAEKEACLFLSDILNTFPSPPPPLQLLKLPLVSK